MAVNNAINLKSAGVVTFDGAGSFTGSSVTQHGVVVAGASNALSTVAPGSNNNVLTSNGTDWTSAAAPAGSWGGYTVTTVTGTLTNSQIKHLNGTPIQIVAAQGSGKSIVVIAFTIKMAYGGTTAFTAAASQTISFAYGTSGTLTALSNAQIVATASRIASGGVVSMGGTGTFSNIDNAALNWFNPVATEISGDAANDTTMPWAVTYIVVSI